VELRVIRGYRGRADEAQGRRGIEESIATPCSVNANGFAGENFIEPGLSQFVITSFHSEALRINIKSVKSKGRRSLV
jgi:hypothetical protein